MWKWSHYAAHYAIVEAVEPFKLHPTSMWIYARYSRLNCILKFIPIPKNKCRVVWPSHHRLAQNYLRPRKNKCWVVFCPLTSWPKLLWPRKNKCWVVWPSHHQDAHNYYNLMKINVEWSGPLTTVSPKIIMTSKKLMWSGSCQQSADSSGLMKSEMKTPKQVKWVLK